MNPPILYGAPWIWTNTVDPAASVPTDNGFISTYNIWINTTTGSWWICTDAGDWENNNLVWALLFYEPGQPYNSISLAFNTPRQPSLTADVEVLAIVSMTGETLTSSEVDGQIDPGTGFVTVASESVPALAAATKRTINFTVPAGSSYQLTNSGTTSIISVFERL